MVRHALKIVTVIFAVVQLVLQGEIVKIYKVFSHFKSTYVSVKYIRLAMQAFTIAPIKVMNYDFLSNSAYQICDHKL